MRLAALVAAILTAGCSLPASGAPPVALKTSEKASLGGGVAATAGMMRADTRRAIADFVATHSGLALPPDAFANDYRFRGQADGHTHSFEMRRNGDACFVQLVHSSDPARASAIGVRETFPDLVCRPVRR